MNIDFIEIELLDGDNFNVYFVKGNERELISDWKNIIFGVSLNYPRETRGNVLVYKQTSDILREVKEQIELINIGKLKGKTNREKSKSIRQQIIPKIAAYLLVALSIGSVVVGVWSSKKNKNDFDSSYVASEYSDYSNIDGLIINDADIMDYSYYYDGDKNIEAMEKASQYKDIFQKYGKNYGISPTLLQAICAQESSGNHVVDDDSPTIGAMGIEKNSWLGEKVSVYNYEKKKMETITITKEMLEDVDSNIMVGAVILQDNFNKAFKYGVKEGRLPIGDLIGYGLDRYNHGGSEMSRILNADGYWQKNKFFVRNGDSMYSEKILSMTDKDDILEIWYYDEEKNEVIKFYYKCTNSYDKSKSL